MDNQIFAYTAGPIDGDVYVRFAQAFALEDGRCKLALRDGAGHIVEVILPDGYRIALARRLGHLDEEGIGQIIDERDRASDMADKLAQKIADFADEDIGEHSNLNDPWTNALDTNLHFAVSDLLNRATLGLRVLRSVLHVIDLAGGVKATDELLADIAARQK